MYREKNKLIATVKVTMQVLYINFSLRMQSYFYSYLQPGSFLFSTSFFTILGFQKNMEKFKVIFQHLCTL